jgi:protein-S-isoprenylcysteine O-methyltransferase Ste14
MMHFRNNGFFFAKTLVDILAKVEPSKARILTLGSSLGSSHAGGHFGDPFSNRGIMNVDHNSSAIGATGTPGEFGAGKQGLSGFISKDLVLDVIERTIVLILFLYFANRLLPRLAGLIAAEIAYPELLWLAASKNLDAALLVISESLGVFLILTRRLATTVSTHPLDWALSLIAVNAPLLAAPAAASTFVPSQIATALMFAGMIIQISAKAALWRSYGLIPANRGVKTRGPYRFVRHPMYGGYTLIHIGFLLGFPSLQNLLLYSLTFLIEVARLMREELILKKDPLYCDYATRVRYRLLPGVF